MDAIYPRREKFFSQRFHRLMAKLCLAQDIGPLGYALLSIVVSQEDACRYRKPITYYDSQLMPLLGCKSCSQLVKTRKKLVSSGWLHFEAGHKGRASSYWVKIPTQFDEIEDSPTFENDALLSGGFAPPEKEIENARGMNEERKENARGMNEERKESIPYPIPYTLTLSPVEETAEAEEPDSPVRDFSHKVRAKAKEIFHHRWFALKGCLPNLERQDARQEYREIADKIATFPEAYQKLKDYFASPPADHGKTAKLWMIFDYLELKPKSSKPPSKPEPKPITAEEYARQQKEFERLHPPITQERKAEIKAQIAERKRKALEAVA